MGLLDFLFGKKKSNDNDAILRRKQEVAHKRKAEAEAERKEQLRRQEEEQQQITQANKRTAAKNYSTTTDIKELVDRCIKLESSGKIQELQNSLFQLYSLMNKPGGGKIITNYKEKENLALCFAFMLHYDWVNDSDIREVWAENGFYCIIDHIDHQTEGLQGQGEAMIILFTLLCVGRDSLKPKIQNILNKGRQLHNPVFHQDDYNIGAQNVIDQISLLATSGIRMLGESVIPIMSQIVIKFNGGKFFEQTVTRKDLLKYDVMDVYAKAKFISKVIESILNDM